MRALRIGGLLALLLVSTSVHAACNPTNSPPYSAGCFPQISGNVISTDQLLIWRPTSPLASAQAWGSPAQLFAALTALQVQTALGATVSPGTYEKITFSQYGLVLSGANLTLSDIETALGFTPLSGLIASGDATGTASGAPGATIMLTLASVGTAGTYSVVTTDAKGRVTVGSHLAASGDATGTESGGTLALTLASVGTAGTYPKVTVNTKGLVTAGASLAASDIPTLTDHCGGWGWSSNDTVAAGTFPQMNPPWSAGATVTGVIAYTGGSGSPSFTFTEQVNGSGISCNGGTAMTINSATPAHFACTGGSASQYQSIAAVISAITGTPQNAVIIPICTHAVQ